MTRPEPPAAEHHAAGQRMTLSRIVEQLLRRGSVEHSSVTLSRNSKGDTQIEVVVRTGDGSPVKTIDEAEAAAIAVYDRLRERYPHGSEPTNGGPR